jgi:hypothetical protein
VPLVAVIEVREDLVAHTDDLVMQLGRAPCRADLQFRSRYPGSPAETVVYDFLADEQLREVQPRRFLRHAHVRQVNLQHERPAGHFFSLGDRCTLPGADD